MNIQVQFSLKIKRVEYNKGSWVVQGYNLLPKYAQITLLKTTLQATVLEIAQPFMFRVQGQTPSNMVLINSGTYNQE